GLPVGGVRCAVEDLGLPAGGVDQLLAGRTLRAQPAAGDRRVGVALDLHDPLVLDEDPLATADRAVGADATGDPVGGRGPRRQGPGAGRGDRRTAAEHVTRAELPDDRPVQGTPSGHADTVAPFANLSLR